MQRRPKFKTKTSNLRMLLHNRGSLLLEHHKPKSLPTQAVSAQRQPTFGSSSSSSHSSTSSPAAAAGGDRS
jgi:hypothetical protein